MKPTMQLAMQPMAILMALAVTPALAGDPTLPAPEPEMIPAPALSYAPGADWGGAYAGVQLGYGDIDSNGGGLDGNGEIGGLHAGYRWDMGAAVLGAEVDWDTANIDLGATGSLDSVARIKLSAGYDMGPSLIYATAGAARADATVGGAGLADNGWLLGAGVTYAVTGQWTVGGEVLTHRFGNFDGTGIDLDATTATVRVGLRF